MSRRYVALGVSGLAILSLLLSALIGSSAAWAQETEPVSEADTLAVLGTGFSYQGELRDGSGPVNGSCDFRFSLHSALTGGNQLGNAQTVPNVAVNDGHFSVVLNRGSEFGSNAFTGDARWLQIAVRCPAGSGDFSPLSPRQELLSTPYALYASDAASVPWSGISGVPADLADGDADTTYTAGSGLALNGGAFAVVFGGSGVSNAAARSDHNHGGQSWAGVGTLGLEVTLSSTDDVSAALSGLVTNGAGVSGLATATSGTAFGVFGASDGLPGTGVSGLHTPQSGLGAGVFGSSNSLDGTGVSGFAAAASGDQSVGVFGGALAPGARGVVGFNNATTGTGIGVYGSTNSPDGWAGYFNGDVNVTGTLFATAKNFRIDHPLDPEHKYLNHAAVESSEMLNVYSGNATLDANGEAVVVLPEWFEALNTDFRYQLTPIGEPGPNLYIAQPVQNNQFRIAGGTSGMVVSWQVTGVRHDPYAAANPLVVEEDKPADEQGTYMAPAAWGQPAEMGATYDDRRALEVQMQQVNAQKAQADALAGEQEGE